MSESLPICPVTNGTIVLEDANSSDPVIYKVKGSLPDSSTCHYSESSSAAASRTAVDDNNGYSVLMNIGASVTDTLDNTAKKPVSKKAVVNDKINETIHTENEATPKSLEGSDSLPGVPLKVALNKAKTKLKRVSKTYEKVVRNVPRRAINGNHLKYSPVKRQKRITAKTEITVPNGSSKLNSSAADSKSKGTDDQKEDSGAAETILNEVLPITSSSTAISKQGTPKTTRPHTTVKESENGLNLESDWSSCKKNSVAETISLSSLKKESSSKKGVLSHFQIMRRVLNKKALYGALLVDDMYECPICSVRKEKAQYLLLHLKGHTDLTPVFERFQAFGGPLEEIDKKPPDLPKQVSIQNAIELKVKNRGAGKFKLRKKKSKPVVPYGIPILPLISPRMKRKELINSKHSSMTSETIEIKDVPLLPVVPEVPVVEPCDDQLLKPSPSGNMRKRKLALAKISKRSPVNETPEEPPEDIVVDVKKSRLGISHTRALDPELLSELQRVMKSKVTSDNPHKCKFCGKLFIKGQGIYAHYFKHSRATISPEVKSNIKPKQGLLDDSGDEDSAFNDLIPVSDSRETERNRDTDFLTLQELETNVNRLLRGLVKDTVVLKDLGWPERRVSDLVIDILERCSLQPAYCGASRLSQLQCLRKNMGKLFRFCIKEEAMEKYGWNIKLIDIVVREMIATEDCITLNRI